MRALVIEDSRAMRAILVRLLGALGAEVTEVGDAAAALAYFDSNELPHVALVDWHIPGMSGLELVAKLRAQERFRAMPIMMVTSESEPEQILAALDAGADEYLVKPFTKEAVVETLALLGVETEVEPAPLEKPRR
jgi:two-component system, chemotaxis family, chemotaxis protein CheY